MKVHHTLICFFVLSLQDGNPEVTNAQSLFYGVIGGDIKAGFSFNSPGTWKMFCREKCEGENILINATDVTAQTGRYSIEYYLLSDGSVSYVLFVRISKLTESDSGQYSCGLGGSSSSASFKQFGIFVVEALLDGNDDPAQLKHFDKETGSSLTVACSFKHVGNRKLFCRGECGGDNILVYTDDIKAQRGRYNIRYDPRVLYVSITQLTKSDSGRYRCFLEGSSSSSFREFEVTVIDAAGPSATTTGSSTPSLTLTGSTEQPERAASIGVLLVVGLTLALIIILSSLAVLIICIKRKSNRGLRTRGNSEGTNMEDVHYENWTAGSTGEDSTYQSLDLAGRDQDQTYSTLTHHT